MEKRHSPYRSGDSYYHFSPDECLSHRDHRFHRRDDGGTAAAATGKCISSSWTDHGHVTNERDDSTNSECYHYHHYHRERDDYDRHHCKEQLQNKSRNHASPPSPLLNAALPHHRHHRHDDVESKRRLLRFHPPERKEREEGRSKFTPTSTFTFTSRSAIRMKREEDEANIRFERSHHGNLGRGPENRTQFSEASTVIVANHGNAAKAASNEKHTVLAEQDMKMDVLYSPKGGNACNRNPHTNNINNLQQQKKHDHDDAASAHVNTIVSGSPTSDNMRDNHNRYCSIATTEAGMPSSCQQPQPQTQQQQLQQQHSRDVIFSRHPTIIHSNRPRDSLKPSAGKERKSSNHHRFPLHEPPEPSSIAISNANPTCNETENSTRENKSNFRSNSNHNHNNDNRNNDNNNHNNNIRDKKTKYDVKNLMKLPSHHASSSAKFPPGCPVIYQYRVPHSCSDDRPDTTPVNIVQNGNAITADNRRNGNNGDHNHVRIHLGKVQSVYIDFSSASRELVHAISTKKGKETNVEDEGEELLLIDENSLAYAPQCPIVFHPALASGRDKEPADVIGDDGASVGNSRGDRAGDCVDVRGVEGIVLLCRPREHSSGNDSGHYRGDGKFVYTILLHVPHDGGRLIMENVEMEHISYRPKHDGVAVLDPGHGKCIAMMDNNVEVPTMAEQSISCSGNGSRPDGGKPRIRHAGGLKQIDVNSYRNGSSNWRTPTTASGTVHTRKNDNDNQSITERRFVRGKVDNPATSDYCTKEDDQAKENQMPLTASTRNTQNQCEKGKAGISITSDVCMKGDNPIKENQAALTALRRRNIQSGFNSKVAYTNNDHAVMKQTRQCNSVVPQTTSNKSISSKNTKVFVQNLLASDIERGVRDYFARFGSVVSLTFPLFSSNKTYRNCAMIEFESSESSAAVVSKGTHSFLGRTLSVKYYDDQQKITATACDLTPKRVAVSKDKRIGRTEKDYRVFVSNIRICDHTDEDIRNYFSQFGAVVSFERYQRRTDLGEVEFQSCSSSAAATSKTVHVLNGHRIHVRPYDPTNNYRGSKKSNRDNTRNNSGDRDDDTTSRARQTPATGNGRRTKRPMIGEPLHSKRPCRATKSKSPESGVCKPNEDILSNWWMPPR